MDVIPFQKNRLGHWIRAIWRRRLRPVWQDYHWVVLGGLILFTIILYIELPPVTKILAPAQRSWSLFRTAIGAASMTYVLAAVKVFRTVFQPQIQAVRLKLTNDHAVVCGMGKKASLFIKSFYEDGYKVVLISNDKNISNLEQFRDLNILVLMGDPTDIEILQKARVHKAQYLVAVCENDGDNAEIAVNARALVSDAQNRVLTCLVHITNPRLCTLLKEREIMSQKVHSFRMEFLNVFESGARQILKEFPGFGESARSSRSHLLIVGLGPMGTSLTLHAGMLWKIAAGKSIEKLAITIVDKDADRKKEFFQSNYHQLNDFWELIPVTLDTDSPQFHQGKFLWDGEGRCFITAAYICLEEDSRSLAAALALFQHLRHENVPIVVQMDSNAGLAKLLQDEDNAGGSFANLHSFGLLDHKCKSDLLLYSMHETLARAIHQDYLLIQKNMGMTLETNPSLVPWNELPEHIKESNRRQADDIGKKLKTVHCDMMPLTDWDAELFEFSPEEIEILARMEHERWLNERRNEGWTYDPGAKDLERKKSPVLLDWDKLSEDVKKYNREAIRSLPVFLAGVGFQIFGIQPKQQNVLKGP